MPCSANSFASTLPERSQSSMPCAEGIRPVSSDARAGEHTGDAQKKSSKRIPSRARRSRLGVISSGVPAQCMAHAP